MWCGGLESSRRAAPYGPRTRNGTLLVKYDNIDGLEAGPSGGIKDPSRNERKTPVFRSPDRHCAKGPFYVLLQGGNRGGFSLMVKAAIYARVSTDRQNVDLQLEELREYIRRRGWKNCAEHVDNGFTGSDTRRPAFTEMMKNARKRKFDVLVVWKLDRLGRSLKDLIMTLHELGALGIDFASYSDSFIDTSTPHGKLIFHVIGAVSEFERELIRERVKAGLENARRKGRRLGRPMVDDGIIEEARALRGEGMSFRGIARRLGVPESTVRTRLKAGDV